jgi:hypothetical protein
MERKSNQNVVKHLIEKGADLAAEDNSGRGTFLQGVLSRAGVSVDAVLAIIPKIFKSIGDKLRVADSSLDASVSFKRGVAQSLNAKCFLKFAARKQCPSEIFGFLLQNLKTQGLELDLRESAEDGDTAFHRFIRNGHVECATMLINDWPEAIKRLKGRGAGDATPLHLAAGAAFGSLGLVGKLCLIFKGFDVDMSLQENSKLAGSHASSMPAEKMIDAREGVGGTTALSVAIGATQHDAELQFEITQVLVDSGGADVNAGPDCANDPTWDREFPIGLCSSNSKTAAFLLNHGAQLGGNRSLETTAAKFFRAYR